jgi:hypothetical protein
METVNFYLRGFHLIEFDTLNRFDEGEEYQINVETGLVALSETRSIFVMYRMQCMLNDTESMVVATRTEFVLDSDFWQSQSNETEIIVPKSIAGHIAAIAISTTRGALYVKCQGTSWANFLMPLVNAAALYDEDKILPFGDMQPE